MLGGEVRVAIAGTGFMGAVHARSARLAGARLVGVAGSSPEKSALAAAQFGAERPFATAEELGLPLIIASGIVLDRSRISVHSSQPLISGMPMSVNTASNLPSYCS